jgi:hypothetical protein
VRLLLLLWLGLFAPLSSALAHPLTPAALVIRERAPRLYDASFRRSAQLASLLQLELPKSCTITPRGSQPEDDQVVDHYGLICPDGLEGKTVRILGLGELELSALVHVELGSGESVRELLAPYRTSYVIPARTSALAVLGAYVELGAEHLVTGYDHLLFVFGLLLLVPGLKARLGALTAFTVGHSITLCLAALELFSLPQTPVEVGIALSLVVLALEVLERRHAIRRTFAPWWMASAFGLLHGLGFASALAESGLPPHAVPLSLFGFNLGIELGQAAVVLALAPLFWLARKVPDAQLARARTVCAYAIGSLAAMWCLERALPLF